MDSGCDYENCDSKLEAIMFSPSLVPVLIGLFGLVEMALAQSCAAE
jgi:hypothetical protein